MSDPTMDRIALEEAFSRIEHNRAQVHKLLAEALKLDREALKFNRERQVAPWQIVLSAMTAGAALFGAGAAFWKVLGS